MWFIVKILWTWNLFFTLLEISKPLFFFPIFGNAIITIVKKKNYSPISAMTLPSLLFFFFFYSTPHSGTLGRTGLGKLGSGISAMPLPKFKDFLSPLSSFSPTFWLNFGNAIAEIQSLSSDSQLSLNSWYNANKLWILQY